MTVIDRVCDKTVAAIALMGLVFWGSLVAVPAEAGEPKQKASKPSTAPTIGDKTLVTWVYLANTTQRGGAVLTLITPAEPIDPTKFAGGGGSGLKSVEPTERFDAIVFGELAPGRWMAGSDCFHRTQRDQAAFPVETADAKTLVQVAIVYEGNKIHVYRNGKLYSAHEIDKPQTFRQDAMVLIGLRYVGTIGKHGFFDGAVEEVHIYDVALSTATIAALEPGKPSAPKPLAQWTFEDGTAADSMKTFPPGKLCGSARIADGKLHLDGKTGYMIAPLSEKKPMDTTPQAMFYKPTSPETGSMWDSWVFYHDGMYYLYSTCNAGGNLLDNVSMATSPDGVHWTEVGRVLSRHPDSDWLGTGSTWKSPNYENDGKFFMDYCERREGGRRVQEIYFAESTDLINWERLDDQHVFQADQRWYDPGIWTTIWTLPRPEGGLYGYWTCYPRGGKFGFGQTLDGVTWEALPPPVVQGVAGFVELGAVEKIGPKYYAMVGAAGGMMKTLVADSPDGPFILAEKNPHLLGAKKLELHRALPEFTYFARFCRAPDGLLVNHHTIARGAQGGRSPQAQVYFGLLKTAVVDDEGTLRLGWWKGNEKLKDNADVMTLSKSTAKAGSSIAMLGETLDADAGVILEGRLTLPVSKDAAPVGLYVSCGENHGSAILVYADGHCEFGEISADGSQWDVVNRVDREMDFGPVPTFRLLLKESLLEFYLNDILIECYSLPANSTGQIGLLGGEPIRIKDIKAWQCPAKP